MGSRQGSICHQRHRHPFSLLIAICSIFVVERRGSVVVASLCLPTVANLRHRRHSHRQHIGSTINNRQDSGVRFLHDIHCPIINLRCELSSSSTTKLMATIHDNANSSNNLPSDDANDSGVGVASSANQETSTSPTVKEKASKTKSSSKWEANDFDNDRRLLEMAIARESAVSDLQQQQRKYTLDYGFARNRRPLVRDLLHTLVKIGAWLIFLVSVRSDSAFDGRVGYCLRDAWNQPIHWHKLHILAVKTILAVTTVHHWAMGIVLPLLLLLLVKCGTLGPDERTLDEYSNSRPGQLPTNAKTFFYSSTKFSKQRARAKDTGNFVLCLLENWSSAVALSLMMRFYTLFASHRLERTIAGPVGKIYIFSRLITRIGAAAALHQYPSLLFELRRRDRPLPICRSLAYMRSAVKVLFEWLLLGIASDLAVLLVKGANSGEVEFGATVASLVSILPPLSHLIALGRIVRISKCSAVSLSEATAFPPSVANIEEDEFSFDNHRAQIKWRYQLRWRTPQRLLETIRTWKNYFFTGHVPLLLEMDEWKKQPIQFDDFSTEGTQYKFRGDTAATRNNENNDECMTNIDAIAESLSLIFRDRDAGIRNATEARLSKHQESYDTKTLDDVLGVAVQQTFGIGLSFDFDHFDVPVDEANISIHQLRARMAKSAIRRKRELDNAMRNELDALRRLKDTVITPQNNEVAESDMKSVEQGIRERHADEIARMTHALCTLIPINADAPKGTERYDSPILIAQYVDLKAAPPRGEYTVTKEVRPDPISVIEDYVRKDFGDEAADAYRRDEIAARQKEKGMLSKFREQYGEIEDGDAS